LDITKKQKAFFEYLSAIQEEAVIIAQLERKENDTLEDTLYDATYKALYEFLLLIDGYSNEEIKLDLIDKETGISMRTNTELHDECASYLRYKSEGQT